MTRQRRVNTDPMRVVTRALERGGKVGFGFAHGRGIYTRWWDLVLECGHTVERTARYERGASGGRRGFARMHHLPSADMMLPPPKRVRCEMCASEAHAAMVARMVADGGICQP
jgi:hypothetical protein